MRYNHIVAFFQFVVIFSIFYGCASKEIDVRQSMIDGKSIIIMPKNNVYGKKLGFNRMENKNSRFRQFYLNSYSISKDYLAVPIEAGVFYVKLINNRTLIKKRQRKITYNKKYTSSLGEADLQRTPMELKYRLSSGETIRKKIDSYYITDYYLNRIDGFGTITINKNEIVLMPNVLAKVFLVADGCRFANYLDNLFLLQLMHDIATNFASDELESIDWICPVKSIEVDMKIGSLNDFLSQANRSIFSEELIEKIVVRDFEKGEIFKGIEPEILDGGKTEKYTINATLIEQKR